MPKITFWDGWFIDTTGRPTNPRNYPSTTTFTTGVAFKFPSQVPISDNGTFQYWESQNEAHKYYPGQTYTVIETTELRVLSYWKKGGGTSSVPNPPPSSGGGSGYTVTFDPNGGTVNPTSKTVTGGTRITLPTPTYSGMKFSGWMDYDTNQMYNAGSALTVNRDYDFVAVWGSATPALTTYYLRFNGNNGTGVPSTISKSGAQNVSLPSKEPTRTNYNFQGWSTSKDGPVQYKYPATIYLDRDITLYACWAADTVVLTYNGQPYSYTPVTDQYDSKGYVTLRGTTFTPSNGAKQTGWQDASGKKYSFYASFNLTSDTTLYAVYGDPPPTEYTVTFDPKGGTCYTTTRTVKEGETLNPLPTATRTDYDFVGWYDANGSQYTNSTAIYRSTTLYARWNAKALNNPTISASPTSVLRGGTVNVKWSLYGSNIVYQLRCKVNDGSWTTIYSSTSQTSYTYTVPADFRWVQFGVRATNTSTQATSLEALSNEVTIDEGTLPGRPSRCTVRSNENDSTTIFTNSSKSTYDVSWSEVSNSSNNLIGYEAQYCTSNNTSWRGTKTFGVSVLNTSASCSDLVGASWVQWRVRARDYYGRATEWRESSQVTVSALNAPVWAGGTGWITYPVPSSTGIREGESFKIQWSAATDTDGDLYKYVLAREDNESGSWTANTATLLVSNVQNGQPEWTDVITSTSITKVRYRVYAEDSTQRRTTVITGPVVNVTHNTPPKAPQYVRAQVEQTAIDEGHPYSMQPLKGGEYNLIQWARAEDAENNVTAYQLECSLDGEIFHVIRGFNTDGIPTDTYFYYFIPKNGTERHDTAQFRVKARDAYGEESPYIMSRTYNISNNATPVIQGEYSDREYAGTFEKGFPIAFNVADEEGENVEIEIAVYDGNAKIKTLSKFNASTPYTGTYTISDREFSELPMRRLTLRITARDREGMGTYQFDFTRKGTYAYVTLRAPIRYRDPITACRFTQLQGLFPGDCKMLVEATNNANDPMGGYWEDVTQQARTGMLYTFQNKIAVYGAAFNFRIRVERGPSGQSGYIERVRGYFETATEKGETF